jgi:hypothetical protein
MNHTEGPWTVGGSLIAGKQGQAVAMVLHRPKPMQRHKLTQDQDHAAPELPEADANGRVLAAAPELLKFVRKVARATFSENREYAHTVTDEARYLLAQIERGK